MVTVSKSIEEFKAEEGKSLVRCPKKIETTKRHYNLNNREMLEVATLTLRGKARDHVIRILEKPPNASWAK